VGKRQLERATASLTGVTVEVVWRPFQLRPNNPPEGVLKPPDTPDNPRVGRRMREVGEAHGINFTGKCDRSPNTLLAHTAMEFALEKTGSNNGLAEDLFMGYYTNGVFPSKENLVQMAVRHGMARDELEAHLSDPAALAATSRSVQRWSSERVRGVPTFRINGEYVFSGAVGADRIREAILNATQ